VPLCRELTPVQGVLQTVYKIYNFIINSEWEQAREPNPSREMKEKYFYTHYIPLSKIIFLKKGQQQSFYEGESINRSQMEVKQL
jgi:hypothetical protein